MGGLEVVYGGGGQNIENITTLGLDNSQRKSYVENQILNQTVIIVIIQKSRLKAGQWTSWNRNPLLKVVKSSRGTMHFNDQT